MRLRALLAALFALTLVFSGCGDDDDNGDTSSGTTEAPDGSADDSESTEGEGSEPSGGTTVKVADSDLGEILVTQDGFTLYAFTNDSDGTPTCTDACAGTWPPMPADEAPTGVEGIEDGVLSVVEGADGNQLKAGDFPLYLYSGDATAGETKGHGVGGVWFAVTPDGSLVEGEGGGGEDGGTDTTEGADTTDSDY